MALFYKIFGVCEAVGRLLSVAFSLTTVYFLYLLVKECTNNATALW